MCGIAGYAGSDAARTCPGVVRMCDAMRPRGPDACGVHVSDDSTCVLGNRRLAIIDVSETGHMPMGTNCGRFWITYNGETYNFRRLRADLEARGHTFRSGTDTEVVLHLFQEYGESCVERLQGMFAFAIWDERERSLFLARDRFGIKPLYFARLQDGLVFASEVRALLASGLVEREADPVAVVGYLMMGSVPDHGSVVRGVESVAPGHCAVFHQGRLAVRRYWDHANDIRQATPVPASRAIETLRGALKTAARRQIVSDVPLGLFLSAGMDSTTLIALVRAVGQIDIRTVSVGFGEAQHDETREAGAVARRFGTDHVHCYISGDEVLSNLDRVVRAMDQPSVDAINTYFVSRAAREAGLTVALSGLGADEIFGGYPTFSLVPRVHRAAGILNRIPRLQPFASTIGQARMFPYSGKRFLSWGVQPGSVHSAWLAVRGLFTPSQVRRLLPIDRNFDPVAYAVRAAPVEGLDGWSAVSVLESRLYMHNQLLRDTDAMSMSHSLEVRVPFLDEEVVSAFGATSHAFSGAGKPALAAAREIYFPAGLPAGPKRGFSLPLGTWLRGPLARVVEDTIDHTSVLSREGLRQTWTDFRAGRLHWSYVWAPIVLERWLREQRLTLG